MQKNTKVYNRVKWLLAFVLCNNREGLEAIGSFTTASRCLQVGLARAGYVSHEKHTDGHLETFWPRHVTEAYPCQALPWTARPLLGQQQRALSAGLTGLYD